MGKTSRVIVLINNTNSIKPFLISINVLRKKSKSMIDEPKKNDEEVIELASDQLAEIFVASIDEQASKPKNTECTKEK